MNDQERYDDLTKQINDLREQQAAFAARADALDGERQEVAERLAAAATSDADLIRWCSQAEGLKRLTAVLQGIHPAIKGFAQYRRLRNGVDVWLMPEVDLPWAEEIDSNVEKLAEALVEFGYRFGVEALPPEAHSSRIAWAKDQQMQPGWVPVYLTGLNGAPSRWGLSFDPETRVAKVVDSDGYERTDAGTLPQMLVAISRRLYDIGE
jgi:hypothetical protein